jgi:hypothetical protein
VKEPPINVSAAACIARFRRRSATRNQPTRSSRAGTALPVAGKRVGFRSRCRGKDGRAGSPLSLKGVGQLNRSASFLLFPS